jgi:hypothetical protein
VKIELGAEVDEEEQQQEVADAGQACIDSIAIVRRCQREAGEEGACFLGETGPFAQRSETRAPGDGEDQQQFLRLRHAVDDPGQNVAHQQIQARAGDAEAQGKRTRQRQQRPLAAITTQGAHHHHRDHDGQVLDDQEADSDAAVQESISRLSESSLTMMIVLEKVSATAT